MYVISYPELTTTVLQIQRADARDARGVHGPRDRYLILVWTMSALIRLLESHLALPEERSMSLPGLDRAGRPATCSRRGCETPCKIAAIALVGSALVGDHARDAADDRVHAVAGAHPALHRGLAGLPILVTIFIMFFALPAVALRLRFDAAHRGRDRAHPLGKRAGGRGDARRGRSRFRASSTRPHRRSASAGSAATPSSSCRRRFAACCRRS